MESEKINVAQEKVTEDVSFLDTLTKEELQQRAEEYDQRKQRFDVSPSNRHLLGRFTIVCLMLNRTVGSGIFTVPPKVLAGTGSIGGALIIWAVAGIISLCATYTWLELGLTVPRKRIWDNGEIKTVSTPRSGGEKNFLEYISKKPKFFITSVYGIMFIVLGNISGNAVAFGIYVLIAAGHDPVSDEDADTFKGPVAGLAIGLLTFCAALHIFTRRGGIWLSNGLAVFKVLMLLGMIIMGYVHAGGKYLQSSGIDEIPPHGGQIIVRSDDINNAAAHNFNVHTAFATERHDLASYADSLLYALFAFVGFEQPFCVLSEVKSPRRRFPKYIPLGMAFVVLLFVMLNISYFCVIPREVYTSGSVNTIDFASTFLHYLFDTSLGPQTAKRVMAALIALSLVGNVSAMTFTASRVKQELAKEGIIPCSLFFATGTKTPWAWLKERFSKQPSNPVLTNDELGVISAHYEKSPAAALLLHWFTSVLLIAVTAFLKPAVAYSFLTGLKSYTNWMIFGALVSGGLFYLKVDSWLEQLFNKPNRRWSEKVNYLPWCDPIHVLIYFAATMFLVVAAFIPPSDGSPFNSSSSGYPWYLIPSVGCSTLAWGAVWYVGLISFLWLRRKKKEITRLAYLEKDKYGNYVQVVEIVEHNFFDDVPVDGDDESDDGGST